MNSEDFKRYDASVASIYHSALDPAHTQESLKRIVETIGCSGASWIHVASSGELLGFHACNHDPATQSAYSAHFHAIDPGVGLMAGAKVGTWAVDNDAFDPGNPSHREYRFDFCHPHDIYSAVGIKTFQDAGGIALLSLQRASRMPAFRTQGEPMLTLLQPHLLRAAQLRASLGSAAAMQGLAEAALDQLSAAVFVVSQSARVVFANRAGQELLAAGTQVRQHLGYLSSPLPDTAAALRTGIARACKSPESAKAFTSRRLPTGQQLHISSVNPRGNAGWLGAGTYAMVVIADESGGASPIEYLQNLLGITPAEARLVSALASGDSLQQVAASTGTTLSTLRSQLASVFSKSGIRSQGQLVALVSRLPKFRDR